MPPLQTSHRGQALPTIGPSGRLLSKNDPHLLEVERFATGWWTLGPSYGYRRYRETFTTAPALGAVPVLASRASFAYVQLDVLGEQPLPLRTRCRLFASGRIEQHSDPAQDARSLYISLDVRRLF